MQVKAPGVIKLLGEHSVIYGKLALAAAISKYATTEVKETEVNSLDITLEDLEEKPSQSFWGNRLETLYKSWVSRKGINEFITENDDIRPEILPLVTIAARLMMEQKVRVLGRRVSITSEVPMQRGCASSAACCTAFTSAMIRSYDIEIDDQTAIEIARDGERILHKNENAGGIDVSTAYLGGYTTFSKETKAQKESIDAELVIILIDTGPKPSTDEMVGSVTALHRKDTEKVDGIMDDIAFCTVNGLRALRQQDMRMLGIHMFDDHRLLERLGLSTKDLNRCVEVAMDAGAVGAKLSGGGGGGIAIALVYPSMVREVEGSLKRAGFDTQVVSVSKEGARDSAKNAKEKSTSKT